jgi:hypothetical protein
VYYTQQVVYDPEEAAMETLLLIIALVIVALVLFRPAPRTQIIYVPMEVVEEPQGELGCLPLIVVAVLLLLALGVIRF